MSGGLVADTSGASGSAEVATPTIASKGGRSPLFTSDPNDDWLGDPESRNRVATRTDGLPTEPGMGDEPALFENPARPRRTGPSLTVDAGVTGAPSGPGYMAQFGGNMTLGQFMSTPLAFLRFGEGRGANVGGGNVDLSQAGRDAYVDRTVSGGAQADLSGASFSAEGFEPPEVAAMSEEQKAAAFAEAEQRGEQETAAAGSGTSSAPGSRYGNLNSPTGQAVYFDGQNWRPVSGAPQDIRWNPDSGTSNAQASATTEAYLSGGQQPGNPNNMSSAATEGRFMIDEEGATRMQGAMYGDRRGEFRGSQGGPALYGNTAAMLAHYNWQRQQPEYKAWMKSRGG